MNMINVVTISNQISIPTIESANTDMPSKNSASVNVNISVSSNAENKEDKFTTSGYDNKVEKDYTKILKNTESKSSNAINKENQKTEENENNENNTTVGDGLTEEEKEAVEDLKKRDAEVRAHEQAHKSAGGSLVRGSSFNEEVGPDGKKYATGGEVQIDISEVPDDPQATIRKMEQIVRAALAPADPSTQDRMVASKASSIAAEARAELYSNDIEKPNNKSPKPNNPLLAYKNSDNNYEDLIGKNLDISINGANEGTLKRWSFTSEQK